MQRSLSIPRSIVRSAVVSATLLTLVGLLLPATGSAAAKIPSGNMVENSTFAQSATGWSPLSARVRTVRDRKAPDGDTAARVRGASRSFGIAAGGLTSTTGARYSAAAWVKGAAKGQRVTLVVSETDASGAVVGQSTSRLRAKPGAYKRVRAKLDATADGNDLSIEVRSKGSRPFRVDAVSLVESPSAPVATGGDALTTGQIALTGSYEAPLLESNGAQYRTIVIRDSMSDKLDELRAAHPEADILLYKNVSLTFDEGDCQYAPFQGTGVNYCDADPNESWFLHRKGSSGQRLLTSDYGNLHMMNVGNAGFQRAWADSVIARLRDAGDDGSGTRYDGVFMDDTNLFPGHGVDGQIAEMTDDEYRSATESFLAAVGPQVQAAGFQAVPNLGMNPWEPAHRASALKVATSVTAINREGFVRYGDSGTLFTTDGEAPMWLDEVKFAEDAQAAGTDIRAITYGSAGDARGQRYARATFLMAWDGSDGGSLSFRTSEAGAEWQPNWTTDVGVPTGKRRAVGQGYSRSYSNGIALVNPGSSGTQEFELGGSYRDPDGNSCVTSVKVGAARGLVLPAC